MTVLRSAKCDRGLQAVVRTRLPLHYQAGSDPHADRPAHVRAASSLAWIGEHIALVQDDANFVALVDPRHGEVRAIELPRGEGGRRQFDDARGNKKFKLDLEACVAISGDDGPVLLALGSGSKKRRRQIVTLEGWTLSSPRIVLSDATTLYERLEAELAFAGSDMNIEGAMVVSNALRLFGRGNGKARGALAAVNATCDLPLDELGTYLRNPLHQVPPTPSSVVQYALGDIDGVALGFTDATRLGEATLYSATAEASANSSVDGPVAGSVLGVIAVDGRARYAVLTDASGRRLREKVEGVLLSKNSSRLAWLVIDADDHERPSELCEVELIGSWSGSLEGRVSD